MDEKMLEVLFDLYRCLAHTWDFFDKRMEDHSRSGDSNPYDSFYYGFITNMFQTLTLVNNHNRDLFDRLKDLSESGQICSLVDNLPTGSKIPKREE